MIEHERSYVFTHEGAHRFLEKQGLNTGSVTHIEDYYLGKGMRVRNSWRYESLKECQTNSGTPECKYTFTRKKGDKSKGYRFEFEEEISEALAKAITQDAIMVVKKERRHLLVANMSYTVTMDFVEQPMRLAILEVEAIDEVVYPIPVNITHKLFDKTLKECPLCAYSLFNRHIGICGGPSSGKSETAKIFSHIINTQYDGNAFHVAEFATTFIQKYKKNPNFWEEFFVWHGQHEREHSAEIADIVISDCPTFLTYIYLLHLPKDAFSASTALVLAKMYKRILFDIEWYSDLIFLKIHKYKENGIRYQSAKEALEIERRVEGFLIDHNISYSTYNYSESDKILVDLFYINE